LVVFVGALSVVFLKRKLFLYQWVSLFVVMGGIFLVGLSGSMIKNATKTSLPLGHLDAQSSISYEAPKVLLGILIILFAQIL
jgi:drug/metabolite transporter (DMT)-like permease